MQTFLPYILIVISSLASCKGADPKEKPEPVKPQKLQQDSTKVSRAGLAEFLDQICARSFTVEVIDLYDDLQTINDDDFLQLDDSLKVRGFVVQSSGRGNWTGGPRMVSLTLSNGKCQCRVDKLYHTIATSDTLFRVTERLTSWP